MPHGNIYETRHFDAAGDDALRSAVLSSPADAIPDRTKTRERAMPVPAILGGQPAFAETLLVGRPNMPDRARFLSRIETMLDSGRLTNLGPMVGEFEEEVAKRAGTRFCVSTCNATVALELAISALGMRGEVVVPSYTFVATAHALWRQGIRPIFCDIDPETHCLDPEAVEASITSQTTGILGVHLWGNTCATAALEEIAQRRGLKLLFDAAHAFGCGTADRPVGSYGDAEVFSFHATKFVHSLEGGAIVTDDADLARRLRLMINFGFSAEDTVSHLGTNGKMTEASAAMGLTSLEAMSDIVEHNRRNYIAYGHGIDAIPGLRLMERSPDQHHNFHYIVVDVDEAACGLTRDQIVAALRVENVLARRYFHPGCHRMEPYAGLFPQAGRNLPVTEAVARRVIVLPTGLAMTEGDVTTLTDRLGAIVRAAGKVAAALRSSEDPRLPYFGRG